MSAAAGILTVNWPAPPGVRALVTQRLGGFSSGPFHGLNLGVHAGDDPATVARNRTVLDSQLPQAARWPKQVHGRRVVHESELMADRTEADGVWTDQAERVCGVQSADCLPVLLARQDGSAVAALHAGWRGLSGGVIEAGAAALAANKQPVQAWLGPCIGPQAFEVGDDVREAFRAADAAAVVAFRPSEQAGKWWADLHQLARQRLQAAGVTAVYGLADCTWSDPEHYFSYRRDGQTGRMAAVIWRAR